METAYCIILINKGTLKVDSCEIFSEPHPTTDMHRYFTVEIFRQTGETYEDARDKVIAVIAESPAYTWLLDIKFSSIEKPDRSATALINETRRKKSGKGLNEKRKHNPYERGSITGKSYLESIAEDDRN